MRPDCTVRLKRVEAVTDRHHDDTSWMPRVSVPTRTTRPYADDGRPGTATDQ
jgi:hypothetical protein